MTSKEKISRKEDKWKENLIKVCQLAVDKWGEELQIKVAIEECAELIKELAKLGRMINGSSIENIAEEIADVEIMLQQLKIIFGCDFDVENFKLNKIERLNQRLNNDFKRR